MKGNHLLSLCIVLSAISLAWVNKPQKIARDTLHVYAFYMASSDGTRYYYSRDITASGFTKGIDYVCSASANICTFNADPGLSHTDATGYYFYSSQIPWAGIDDSGVYYEF